MLMSENLFIDEQPYCIVCHGQSFFTGDEFVIIWEGGRAANGLARTFTSPGNSRRKKYLFSLPYPSLRAVQTVICLSKNLRTTFVHAKLPKECVHQHISK
jgi:hypothetical protein